MGLRASMIPLAVRSGVLENNAGLALPSSKRKQTFGIPIIELYLNHTSGSEMRRRRVTLDGIFREIHLTLLQHTAS